jgi:hypothetical protein
MERLNAPGIGGPGLECAALGFAQADVSMVRVEASSPSASSSP